MPFNDLHSVYCAKLDSSKSKLPVGVGTAELMALGCCVSTFCHSRCSFSASATKEASVLPQSVIFVALWWDAATKV